MNKTNITRALTLEANEVAERIQAAILHSIDNSQSLVDTKH